MSFEFHRFCGLTEKGKLEINVLGDMCLNGEGL
jgi:hypothetical protein